VLRARPRAAAGAVLQGRGRGGAAIGHSPTDQVPGSRWAPAIYRRGAGERLPAPARPTDRGREGDGAAPAGPRRRQERSALRAEQVKKEGVLRLSGLGVFRKRKSKARIGRNPATGEQIKIPARTRLRFTAAKGLKDAVLGAK